MQYLRARYYDGATGRFLARDPLPLLQRYPYAQNNPANYVDPYGLCGLCDWFQDNVVAPIGHHVVDPVANCVANGGDCVTHPLETGWQYYLQLVSYPPYVLYYGSYQVGAAINDVGSRFGLPGTIVSHYLVAIVPIGPLPILGYEVIGLSVDIAIDFIQGHTGRNRSICDEGKEGGAFPIRGGPKRWLRGVHQGCTGVDLQY